MWVTLIGLGYFNNTEIPLLAGVWLQYIMFEPRSIIYHNIYLFPLHACMWKIHGGVQLNSNSYYCNHAPTITVLLLEWPNNFCVVCVHNIYNHTDHFYRQIIKILCSHISFHWGEFEWSTISVQDWSYHRSSIHAHHHSHHTSVVALQCWRCAVQFLKLCDPGIYCCVIQETTAII